MSNLKISRLLSWLIAVLAAVAAAGGFLLRGLYRDNLFVTSAWRGNDIVTLVIAVPVLVVALLLSSRDSRPALARNPAPA